MSRLSGLVLSATLRPGSILGVIAGLMRWQCVCVYELRVGALCMCPRKRALPVERPSNPVCSYVIWLLPVASRLPAMEIRLVPTLTPLCHMDNYAKLVLPGRLYSFTGHDTPRSLAKCCLGCRKGDWLLPS